MPAFLASCFSVLSSLLGSSCANASEPLRASTRRHASLSTRYRNERRLRAHVLKRSASPIVGEHGLDSHYCDSADNGVCIAGRGVEADVPLRGPPASPDAGIDFAHAPFDAGLTSAVEVPAIDDGWLVGVIPDAPKVPVDDEVPCAIVSWIQFFYTSVTLDASDFGRYCRVWLAIPSDEYAPGRFRDIFPLPLLASVTVPIYCKVDETIVLNMSNLSILALNFLWDDCPSVYNSRIVYRCNAAQVEVHRHVVSSVLRMIDRLTKVSATPRSSNEVKPNPDLVSSLVEMGPTACTCVSMSYVTPSLRAQIIGDGGLFRDVKGHRSVIPRFSGNDRAEYAAVTWRGLRSGKLRLQLSVSGGGTVFAVPKATGGQREVWHGRYISSLAPAPPKPRHQPTPSCLLDLEASRSDPLYFSKRDAVSYFDCLTAPECVRSWFARPAVNAGELIDLLDVPALGSLAPYIDGLLGAPLARTTRLYPVACCWPMGFSWSSAVAQDTMLAQTTAVGLVERHLLADDKPSPNFAEVDECFAICTDDVMHWARTVPLAKARLARLDDQWRGSGIMRRPDKDVDWSLHGTAIGCDFDGEDGFLDASSSKQMQALHDAASVLASGSTSPGSVMQVMGSLQWFDLLARSKLAVYDTIYDFEQLPNPDASQVMPPAARGELQASIALAPFWSADLSRPFLPFISATDASTTFGFGVCVADATEDVVRAVASYAEKRGDYVVLNRSVADVAGKVPKRRLGIPHHLRVRAEDFKTILSLKAKCPAHNNVLEAEAYLTWLKWLLRSVKHRDARAVCLVDSKVVLGGVTKGRSSSRPLLRVLRRVGALQLAGNLLTRLVYCPTECNPADAPSRGVRVRSTIRDKRHKLHDEKFAAKQLLHKNRLRQLVQRSPYRAELEALVADDADFWQFRRTNQKKRLINRERFESTQ